MAERPLAPNEIELGRALAFPVFDRHGRVMLKRGDVVRSEGLLQAVLERGLVREEAARPARGGGSSDTAPTAIDDPGLRSVFRRVRGLREAHERLASQMRGSPEPSRVEDCRRIAERIVQACEKDADAAIAAFQIDASDEMAGASARSVQVAVLCCLLSLPSGIPLEHRSDLLCAALTHDIAIYTLSEALNRQSVALSAEQRRALAGHPEAGVRLLQACGVEEGVWLAAVRSHHERLDGSGYPQGLRGDGIAIGARLLGLLDMFTAMIRPRAYREPLQSREVMRQLFLERGKLVDEQLPSVFIREVGFHPPGTLVRLQNGEVAMVTRRGEQPAAPKVRAVVAADGSPQARPLLRDTAQKEFAITGVVPMQRYRSVLTRAHVLWDDDAPAIV